MLARRFRHTRGRGLSERGAQGDTLATAPSPPLLFDVVVALAPLIMSSKLLLRMRIATASLRKFPTRNR